MDDRNDDDPSDNVIGASDEKIIVDGLFGIPNQENNTINPCPSDEIQMEVEYDTKIDHEKLSNSDTSKEPESPKSLAVFSENQGQLSCKERDQSNSKLSEDKNCIILNDGNTFNEKYDLCSVDADVNSFGSHVLCSNSTEPGNSEIPPSFALISENYEKTRKVISENQTNCEPTPESNTKSLVVLPDGNLPSTLSLISANYQDSSSDDSDDNASSVNYVADSDDENSIISVLKDEPVKTRGELDISDLPPIEDLKITVEEEKCQPVGCIKNIVKTLVIVEAFLNQPALDIDSVLFVDRGQRALGRIFDVFGPVNKPYYAVRFNDSEHIKKFDIHFKEPVYCAPQTEYASFVLVSQLLEMKGSDASWRHNNEPPCEFLDYSDDEAEKLAKKKRKKKKCADSEENGSPKDKPNPPGQNTSKKNSQLTASTSNPSAQNSIRPPNTYSPRPPNTYSPRPPNTYSTHPSNVYSPHPPNFSYSPRQFPTYAQHLSSMDYSHTYRQPYNPYYYDQMYTPRPSYSYHNHYRPSGYDYRSQPPMDPNNPNNQFHRPNYDYM